jgi:hypothetical protein
MLPYSTGETSMKIKRILTSGLLAGAMLALPMTATTFAEPASSVNANYVERVNWWHHDYDRDGYRKRGYDENRYYGRGYDGRGWGYGSGYAYGRGNGACANAARLQTWARRDYRSGHPGAAEDVAAEARGARERLG